MKIERRMFDFHGIGPSCSAPIRPRSSSGTGRGASGAAPWMQEGTAPGRRRRRAGTGPAYFWTSWTRMSPDASGRVTFTTLWRDSRNRMNVL